MFRGHKNGWRTQCSNVKNGFWHADENNKNVCVIEVTQKSIKHIFLRISLNKMLVSLESEKNAPGAFHCDSLKKMLV